MLFSRTNCYSGRVRHLDGHQSSPDSGAVRRRIFLVTTALTFVSLAGGIATPAHAQSIWGGATSTTTTPDYNLGTNWSTNPVAPTAAGSSAQFGNGGAGPASTAVSVTAPVTTDSWTFLANSQSYTVTGSAVTFSNGSTLTNNASAGQAISIANNMTGVTLSQAAASTLTISGTNSFTQTLISAGTVVNNGSLTSTVGNSGTFTNNLTVTGPVNNAGTFNNNALGTVSGLLTNNSGTTTNAGQLNGGVNVLGGTVTNSNIVTGGVTVSGAGTYVQTAGTTSGGLTSTNVVDANGGAINGAIANNAGGIFNIGGTVTSNSTFNNSTATSNLLVLSGTYTVSGLVTNSGTNAAGGIAVSAGATLTANGGITNNVGATIVNNGTTNANLSNASTGVVTNNNAWNGDVNVNNGTINNSGNGSVWTTTATGFLNRAGGVVNQTTGNGTTIINATAGGFSNVGTGIGANLAIVNASVGQINGAITNGAFGHFNVTGTVTSNSTFNNSAATSLLAVSATGNYAIAGILTNSGLTASGGGITVAAGGVLTANAGTSNAGDIGNGGTWNGGVTNQATGTIANTGTWNGNLVDNLNTTTANAVNNSGTWNGDATNHGLLRNSGTWTTNGTGVIPGFANRAGGVVNQAVGTINATAGGFSNIGTGVGANLAMVNASGGAINGAITNGAFGQFNVSGTVTSDSTFANTAATSLLAVSAAGNYTIAGVLTNSGGALITVAGGGVMTANAGTSNIAQPSTILNAGTWFGGVGNSGFVGNSGTWNGTALNLAGGTINNSGTWNGNLVDNLNTTDANAVNNTGTWTGAVINHGQLANSNLWTTTGAGFQNGAGGVVNQTAGTINAAVGGFNNTGTGVGAGLAIVNASGGAINGVIANGAFGQFKVTGAVTTTGTFTNGAATSLLNVQAGGIYTVSGLVTNSGATASGGGIVVDAGGRLIATAGGITNTANGTIVNNGRIDDALNNAGVVTNNAIYNADVASNTGTINNAGTWTTLAAGFINNAGGTVNQTAGTINATAGGFSNAGTVNASGGAINGAITNNSLFNVTGTVTSNSTFANNGAATLALASAGNYAITGALTNAGTITMVNGSVLSAGSVANTGTMAVTGTAALTSPTLANNGTIALAGGAGSSNLNATTSAYSGNGTINAGVISLNGTGLANQVRVASATGNVNVLYSVTGSGATGLISIMTSSGAASNTATGASGSTGFYQYQIAGPHTANNATNNTALFVNPAAAPAAAPLTSILSTISSIDASFHQPGGNLVASPQTDKTGQMVGGPWVRASGGVTNIFSTGTVSQNGVILDTAQSKTRVQFSGVQAGADTGWLNLGGNGVNAHFGLTGGNISATATEQRLGYNEVKFEVPFVGLYGLVTKGAFSTDFTYRHSFYNMNVSNPIAMLANAGFSGQSDNVNGSVSYNIPLPNNFFIEPTANLSYTRSTFDRLSILNGGGVIGVNDVKSLLGRAGARVGTAFSYGGFNWSPFVIGLVQNEFEKSAGGTFASTAPGQNPFDIVTNRVGTFYQTSVGIAFQSRTNGLLGFVRADWRTGNRIDGGGILGGVRYTFGP